MPTEKLTPDYVKEQVAAPRTKREQFFDTHLPGLVLQIEASGYATWKLYYRNAGKPRWFKLARYEQLRLAQAREAARARLQEVAAGHDIQAEKKQQAKQARQAVTFAQVAERFFKEQNEIKASTRHHYRKVYDSDLKPMLGRKPVQELEPDNFVELMDRMASTPGKARLALSTAQSIISWAMNKRIVRFTSSRNFVLGFPAKFPNVNKKSGCGRLRVPM